MFTIDCVYNTFPPGIQTILERYKCTYVPNEYTVISHIFLMGTVQTSSGNSGDPIGNILGIRKG